MAISMSVVADEATMENLARLAQFDEIAGPHLEAAMTRAVAIGKTKVISELVAAAESNRSAMASELGGDMQPLAPVNPKVPSFRITGTVARAGATDIVGIVGDVNKKYMRLTEGGRGPGKHPPAKALQDWAEKVLGVTPEPPRVTKKGRVIRDLSAGRAIAHAIAEKGIKGSPVMEKSGEAVERHVMELFEIELKKIAAELGFV